MSGIVTVAYIAATILFILALGGLSQHETARRGNLYGIIGMLIALLAAIFGVVESNYAILIGGEPSLSLDRLDIWYANIKCSSATNGVRKIPRDRFPEMRFGNLSGSHNGDFHCFLL